MCNFHLRKHGLLSLIVLLATIGMIFSTEALPGRSKSSDTSSSRKQSAKVSSPGEDSSVQGEKGRYAPRPEWIPDWAQPGNFHFARLDGGPTEPQKTSRSTWGKTFTSQDKEVLGNLYGKYADQMAGLVSQAGVNWVWLTWSVGFSWQDEAAQREQARQMVERLHQRGIHVTAYMCASSIFWQSMFLDEPSSVGWVKFDPNGVPYRYSNGRDPLRFMADVGNAGWTALEEKRIGAAIDAGFDAIFLDNTSDPDLADAKTMDGFIQELRRYIHQDKHSTVLLLSNYGLNSERTVLNTNMDVGFAEYFEEPGAWGSDWNVRNIRRDKYLRSIIPAWKSLITEYSQFRNGNRSTMFLLPRSIHLSIAEAASFGGSYAWNMEGPYADAVIHGDKNAMASWNAIGQYNRFLTEHKDIYHNATQVANYLVLLPGIGMSFDWRNEKNGLYDALAKRSVLFNLMLVGQADQAELAKYRTVVIPEGVPWPEALKRYRENGGKVDVVDGASNESIDAMLKQPPTCASLRIDPGHDILGNITQIDGGKALGIHILNYAETPASDVRVGVELGLACRGTIKGRLKVLSPDVDTSREETLQISNQQLTFVLPTLDTYVVAVLR